MRKLYQFMLLVLLLSQFSFNASIISHENNKPANSSIVETSKPTISQDSEIHNSSVTGFKETIQDDFLYYPDQFFDANVIYSGNGSATQKAINNHTFTHQKDNLYFTSEGNGTESSVGIVLNFTLSSINYIDGLKLNLFGGANISYGCDLFLYDFSTLDWFNISKTTPGLSWTNQSVFKTGLWNNDSAILKITGPSVDSVSVNIDYVQIQLYIMTGKGVGYSESFSDVTDWNQRFDLNNGLTSLSGVDDDILDFNSIMIQENDIEGIYTDSPHLNGVGFYFECRYLVSNRMNIDYISFKLFENDNPVDSNYCTYRVNSISDRWSTIKFLVSSVSLGNITRIEAIGVEVRGNPGANAHVLLDYLRINSGESMGWQFDGSTTTGVTEEPRDGWSYDISTDGDKLNVTMERNGGTSNFGAIWLPFDITANEANLELDYYQFAEILFEIPMSPEFYWIFIPYVDGKTISSPSQAIGSFFWGEHPETTARSNLKALNYSIANQNGIRIIWYCYSSMGNSTCLIDYAKIYSILNFTITQSDAKSDNVLYVESSELFCSGDTTLFELNLDPVLEIDTVVYSIIEVVRTEFNVEVSVYIDNWAPWETLPSFKMDEGILTRFRFRCIGTGRITSIYFRTTSTNELENLPKIRFVAILPSNPNTENEVQVYCSADGEYIQDVTISALVYPDEFENRIFTMSLTGQDTWTYIFQPLPEGYYMFLVTVSSRYGDALSYNPLFVVSAASNIGNGSVSDWPLVVNTWVNIGLSVIIVVGFLWFDKKFRDFYKVLDKENVAKEKSSSKPGS